MSLLFSPLTIKSVTLRNRIVLSPMCQYSAIDGFANDWHLVHLGSRAVGGAGLIMSEAIAVTPQGRISEHDLGIWSDEHIIMLSRINEFIIANGAIPGIQLAHAGRKASLSAPWEGDTYIDESNGGWKTIAPSPISFDATYSIPDELTLNDIHSIIQSFGIAAKRAVKAGYKVIEIHAAHGYLIHEFLSPLSNQRVDKYGGLFENRIRFLLEIVASIKENIPDNYPLFVRISASDWHTDGWKIEDSCKLAFLLKDSGVDLIDCSSGGILPDIKIPAKPNYQVPFAQEVKKTGILTGAVGVIFDTEQAEKILTDEQADLIFLGRELLRNPYFPLQAAIKMGEDNTLWPKQYERAKRIRK